MHKYIKYTEVLIHLLSSNCHLVLGPNKYSSREGKNKKKKFGGGKKKKIKDIVLKEYLHFALLTATKIQKNVTERYGPETRTSIFKAIIPPNTDEIPIITSIT